jgi:hypothetical protein
MAKWASKGILQIKNVIFAFKILNYWDIRKGGSGNSFFKVHNFC